ncbi:hypothetical protein SCHPADRAFT_943951 [Schizopora paradoxa]|uniref:Heat shock protein 70 n=1 Tax=Schizopora paradoxa TaxID=27342 RepID=A0A0H2RC40_9AGAM|nr:hypothetical protein SCHPADRAFT_943951 [Schizopora paradoxa]
MADKLDAGDKEKLQKAVEETIKWLDDSNEAEKYKAGDEAVAARITAKNGLESNALFHLFT